MMAISASAFSVAWRAAMSSLLGAGRCWARLPGTTLATNPAASRTETLILVSCMKSQFTVFRGPGDRQDCQRISGKQRRKFMAVLSVPGAGAAGVWAASPDRSRAPYGEAAAELFFRGAE